MSEPLNDEEFEYLKGDVKRIVCQITEHEMIEQTERLIATVEHYKTIIQYLKEEEYPRLKEQNAKLRKPGKNDRRQHDLNYPAQAPERRGR